MDYEITSLEGSGKDIVRRIRSSKKSQLLIPPKLLGMSLDIPAPPSGDKYVGLFSSGTTQQPKCIWNTLDKLEENARYSASAFEVEPQHLVLLMAMPWHVAGLSWMLMCESVECDYFFITTRKGEHNLWIKTVQDISPDYLFTVPAVLRALYDEDWFVNNVAYGGYPIKFEEYAKLSPHCSSMYQGYGQTEAGGLISCHKRRSTVLPFELENLCNGKAIEGVELTCSGTQEHPTPIYIYSKTSCFPQTYDSGDVGFTDEEGNIYVAGRSLPPGKSKPKIKKELLGN